MNRRNFLAAMLGASLGSVSAVPTGAEVPTTHAVADERMEHLSPTLEQEMALRWFLVYDPSDCGEAILFAHDSHTGTLAPVQWSVDLDPDMPIPTDWKWELLELDDNHGEV